MFYLGLLLTLVPLGLGAGALGGLLTTQRHLLTIGGTVVLIVLGVITMLGVQLPLQGCVARHVARTPPRWSSWARSTGWPGRVPGRCWGPS